MPRFKSGKSATLSLERAIQLFNRGDVKAFDLIYRRYREYVQRICLCMLRDPVEAEDATQDVFVCLFYKISTFRGESAFSSWLYRLTTNSVLMRFRKNRQRWVALEETDECNESSYPEIGVTDLNLSGVLDRIDLESAIKVLPDGYKAALVLHDIQGYRHREIAEMFGHSIETSKSQLHKAHLRLRKLLGGTPKKEIPQDFNRSVLAEIANSSAKGMR
jgi:RNA polymerase sigma-70 factor (ECF subfamily)